MMRRALNPTKTGEALRYRSLALGVALIVMLGVSACGSASHARPADSLVSRAPWLTIAVVHTVPHPGVRVTREHSEVSTGDPAIVEPIRREVNRMPLGLPGTPPGCLGQIGGLQVRLTFRQQQHGAITATVRVNPYECGPATVINIITPRHGQWYVHEPYSLDELIRQAGGSRLKGFLR